jgi:hypothetical protein
MEEISIIFILVIILTIYTMHSRQSENTKCDKYIPYFDHIYYNDMPKLNTVSKQEIKEEKPESMQDLTTVKHQVGKCNNDSNVMKSRWACYAGIFEKNTSGSNEYTNMDNVINPKHMQKHLGHTTQEKMSASKYHVKNEQFTDDGYYNPDFSYNEKYLYDENEENLNAYLDPYFNSPDKMDSFSDGQINSSKPSTNTMDVRSPVPKPANAPIRPNNLIAPVIKPTEKKAPTVTSSSKPDTPMVQNTNPKVKITVVKTVKKPKYNPKFIKQICDRKKARESSWW